MLRDVKLVGAVLYGDVGDGHWYLQLMRDKQDVSALRERLVFGRAFAEAGSGGRGAGPDFAAMADDTQICGCNGVCKGDIVAAIRKGNLTRCRRCAPIPRRQRLLRPVHRPGRACWPSPRARAPWPAKKTVCECTEAEPRRGPPGHSRTQRLKSMDAVRTALAWSKPEGLPQMPPGTELLPALRLAGRISRRFASSRFVNERVHANIQKDGTYSVVPRMWGGLTTPAELHAIAAVAEKFNIPTVKVTGGQRIDLLGVKKEDLPERMARPGQGRAGLRPCLRQGPAHGEDLRRQRMVPLRHPGFHRAGREA